MVSTSGLVVHAMQVHKRAVTVPNAIDGREDPKVDVFGMRGIPTSSGADVAHQNATKRARQHDAVPVAAAAHFAPQIPLPQPYVPHANFAPMAAFPGNVTVPPIVAAPAWAARPRYAPLQQQQQPGMPAPFTARAPIAVTQHRTATAPPAFSRQHPGGVFPNGLPAAVSNVPASQRGNSTLPSKQASAAPSQLPRGKTVTVVFDREDVCMEELRAKLPRYRS